MESRTFELQLRAILVPMRIEARRQHGPARDRLFERAEELLGRLEIAAAGSEGREELVAEAWRELDRLRRGGVEQAVYHIEELVDAERLR